MTAILTEEQLDELVAYYLKQDAFCYDLETVGDRRGDTPVNEVLWISLATEGRTDVIPLGHPNGDLIRLDRPLTGQGEKRVAAGLPARPLDYSRDDSKATPVWERPPAQLLPGLVFKKLEPLFFNTNILTVGHNLIFDLTSLAKYYGGKVPPAPYFDTMIASFIYDNRNKNKCGLKDCLKREFGYEMAKGVGAEVEKYSFNDVYKYSYLDAKYTWLLYQKLINNPMFHKVRNIMDLEMAVLEVLCDMKLTGAPIDIEALTELSTELEAKIEQCKAKIFSITGRPFNINSNAEKQALLFGPISKGGRGLKAKTKTASGNASVSSESLEEYKGDELVDALLEYSEFNKLMTTYVTPYLGGNVERTTNGKTKVEERDSLLINGRIHGDFVQHGAETGRFSSRNPNLQNVPNSKSDWGMKIRNLFCAPEGYKLVVADYSQIEPRIIASLTKDPTMISAYENKEDIYTTLGSTVGLDRSAGKVLVLAMSYGVGPDKISRSLGVDIDKAKEVLDSFADKFPTVYAYKKRLIAIAKNLKENEPETETPFVTTVLGRRRYFPDLTSSDRGFKAAAERQVFNTKIQGSAADIMKIAMIRAHKLIPEGAKLILTVHDELVTLTPDHLAEETAAAIRKAMEEIDLPQITVPLIAEITTAQRWGDAK